MTATEVLAFQLSGSLGLIEERLERTGHDWVRTAFPGANPIGFILWHCTRTIDWGIQCAIRGVGEVARRPEWQPLMPERFLFGAGITSEAAREVARSVSPETLAAYLQVVRSESLGWLEGQADGTLEGVPDFHAHNQLVEGYTRPEVWVEISGLEAVPTWQIVTRPCVSHIRVHIGEVDTLSQVLSGSNRA